MTLFLTIAATLGIGYYIGKLHGRRIERRLQRRNLSQAQRRRSSNQRRKHKEKVERLRTISVN